MSIYKGKNLIIGSKNVSNEKLQNDIQNIKLSIKDVEAKGLSSVGAKHGQVPTADGNGSFDWKYTTDIDKPFEKILLYYGYPSCIGGSTSLESASKIYSSYDMCIFGDQYENADHEDHNNTVTIFNLIKTNNPNTRIVGYVPIGVTNVGSDSGLTVDEVKERINLWIDMGVNGIFLDEFGYDYGVTRVRQNECVKYCHDNGLFCIANSWETKYAFSKESITIESIQNNPDNLAPELNENDYYLYENLFYYVDTDYDGNIKYDSNGQPIMKSSSAWRINTISEYYDYIDTDNGDTASWKDLYGTKLMCLDAIPSSVDEKEMYRLRTMSVIGSVLLNIDAVAFGDENWGSSGAYFDWTVPSSLNLSHNGRVSTTTTIANAHWYQFTYNGNSIQINNLGGLRQMDEDGGYYIYYHMYKKSETDASTTYTVKYAGEDLEITLQILSDTSANVYVDGVPYVATREAINNWTDELYYQEWPSTWSANINEHMYSLVFDLQFADDIVYSKDTHYCLVDSENIQNIWQNFFGLQKYVYDAVEKADNATQYMESAMSKIDNATTTIDNAVNNATTELQNAKKIQEEAATTLDAAIGDLTMLSEGFAFKETEW